MEVKRRGFFGGVITYLYINNKFDFTFHFPLFFCLLTRFQSIVHARHFNSLATFANFLGPGFVHMCHVSAALQRSVLAASLTKNKVAKHTIIVVQAFPS